MAALLNGNQIKATRQRHPRDQLQRGNAEVRRSALASTFLNANVATRANMRNGGAIIDTNGNSVTIVRRSCIAILAAITPLMAASPSRARARDPLGCANTYTGNTTINAGGVTLDSAGSLLFTITNSTNSAISERVSAHSMARSSSTSPV